MEKELLDKITEIQSYSPQKGDVLFVTIKSEDLDDSDVRRVRDRFSNMFSDLGVRVVVLSVGTKDSVEYAVKKEIE